MTRKIPCSSDVRAAASTTITAKIAGGDVEMGDVGVVDTEMGDAGVDLGGRRWEELNRDLLVQIFGRVGVADSISGVSCVCSSWRDASLDPLCWKNLDFREWNSISFRLGRDYQEEEEIFGRILDFCLERGDGRTDSVFFPHFADEIDLHAVADSCPELVYFSLPNPDIDDEKFCEAISKLKFLTGMAVDEDLIKREVLEHVGKSCAYFTELRIFSEFVDKQMASDICKFLPGLRKLETTDSNMTTNAILTLLNELKELEHLDISGYENSAVTEEVIIKAQRLQVFVWNSRIELGEFMDCSYCTEDRLLQRSCECMMPKKIMEWLTQLS